MGIGIVCIFRFYLGEEKTLSTTNFYDGGLSFRHLLKRALQLGRNMVLVHLEYSVCYGPQGLEKARFYPRAVKPHHNVESRSSMRMSTYIIIISLRC